MDGLHVTRFVDENVTMLHNCGDETVTVEAPGLTRLVNGMGDGTTVKIAPGQVLILFPDDNREDVRRLIGI